MLFSGGILSISLSAESRRLATPNLEGATSKSLKGTQFSHYKQTSAET